MIYHMGLDVRNFMRHAQYPQDYTKFTRSGVTMSPDEAVTFLIIELGRGRDIIPTCRCDNFDYKKGCQGHPDTEQERDTKKTTA